MITLRHISECYIKPKYPVDESNQPYYLSPWDLGMLSFHYIQKGLLFAKPSNSDVQEYSTHTLLKSLKDSLQLTLVHFYPLAGQLVVQTDKDQHKSLIYVDCNQGPGARFIHASLDTSISDIISPTYVPAVVHSLFDHDRAVNYDGHTRPLLSLQVTELLDGVFIGCSINHALVDGTSYWRFWNTWSEIHRSKGNQVPETCLPILERWCTDIHGPIISLPFTHPDEFVSRYEAPQLRERFFHFSSKSIQILKAKANEGSSTSNISSFQALTAFVWRTNIRATSQSHKEVTNCRLATSNRSRLDPPLPQTYFGNCINVLSTSTTVGELLDHDLGWAALLLHQLVGNYNDKAVRGALNTWLQSPVVYQLTMLDSQGITMSSSPRFEMHGNEFGLGKPVAVRSGYANKFAGAVTAYPGYEGGGSVDLEICLPPDSMRALESNEEFMAAVSPHIHEP